MDSNNEYFASINEVSKKLSVPAYTLRYWEKQFPSAIRPTTGAGGRRYYRTETVNRLMVIKELLYTRGMTIAGVKKILREGGLSTEIASQSNNNANQQKVHDSEVSVAVDNALKLLKTAREMLAGNQ